MPFSPTFLQQSGPCYHDKLPAVPFSFSFYSPMAPRYPSYKILGARGRKDDDDDQGDGGIRI